MLDSGPHNHAELMDKTYRHQRLIYDVSRKYYLFGRDHLICDLKPRQGSHVLEIACGTGRNLQVAARKYPQSAFYGIDISSEMLRSAREKLGDKFQLAQADACHFDAETLFNRAKFDRIFVSYGISMIPDWEGALRQAVAHLAPGGQLHVVDFSDQHGWPQWFRSAFIKWLEKFHVKPRRALRRALNDIAHDTRSRCDHHQLYCGYAQYGVLEKPR